MFWFDKNSKLVAASLLFVFMLAGCGGAEERKAKYLERGKTYFNEENYEKARVEFRNVLQIDPKSAAPYFYLGQIAEKNEDWRKAYSSYSKAVELDPEFIDARVRLGSFYVLAGEIDNAVEQAEEVLSREPDNADALTLNASILVRQEKEEEAVLVLRKILEATPGHVGASTQLSVIYGLRENTDESIAILERALENNQDNIGLQIMLYQAYVERDENEKAEEIMLGLVNSHPDVFEYRATLALHYARNNRLDEAERVMLDSIEADPEDVQRYLVFVDFYGSKFSNERAIAELQTFIANKPELTELRFALARLYLKSEQFDEAENIFQDVIREQGLEVDGLAARNMLAAQKSHQGELDQAKILVNEVLAESPQDNKALLLSGRISLQEKDYLNAVTAFRSALKDQPDSVEIMTLLAGAHQANGEVELARENLSRAVELNPGNADARLRLASFLASSGELDNALEQLHAVLELDPAAVPALRAKAEILARQGDVAELEVVLTQLEQASPETGLGAFGKGRLYKQQKKYPEALAAYEEALAREPDSMLALNEVVKIEIAMGNPDAAIKRLENVLKDNPGHPAAHDLLGIAYVAKKDYVTAERELKLQLDVNAKSNVVYMQLAGVRTQQNNLDGAEASLLQGLDVLPGDTQLTVALANFYSQQGDLDKAVAVYTKALDNSPNEPRYVLSLAGIKERQQKYEDSITLYEDFLVNDPDNVIAINNLAALLADYRTDEVSLNKAKELASQLTDAKLPALLDTVGWVHYRTGDYDKAAEVLSGVVEQAPDVSVFRYHLGMTYYKQGDNRAAKEILSKAVAEDMKYNGVDEARRVYMEIVGSEK